MRVLMVRCTAGRWEIRQFSYPLGLMYLTSYLRERQPDHHLEILDLSCHKNPDRALEERLRALDPHVVAVSAFTSEAENLHQVARAAKSHSTDAVVVAGGAHVSAWTDDVVEDQNVDVLAFGEGEETFDEIVTMVSNGNAPRGVAGTAWRTNGGTEFGPPREPIPDLDKLPFPAWDMVTIGSYARLPRSGNVKRNRYMPIFTSRGCPYKCAYCHRIFPKRFRSRSAENVLRELRMLVETYGIHDIEIHDDAFNLDLHRAKKICQGIIEGGLDLSIAFPNGVRADRLDRELVSLLAQAGTTNMAVAVDTASTRLQKRMGRFLDITRVQDAIGWARREGITAIGYFMLGFPTETLEELEATIRFAVESELPFASFFIVTPYPGTPLWKETFGQARAPVRCYRDLNVFSGHFNLSQVDGRELRRLQRSAYWQFYRRRLPGILRMLPRLRVDWWNATRIALGRLTDRSTLEGVPH
jgi:anaerobic magnesium-protoporphyrin IX monomethyl ester cyclase